MRLTVPAWLEIGVAIALGAILVSANGAALCDAPSQRCPAATSCAHPRTVGMATFLGKPTGLATVTVDGKTNHALCFAYDGARDSAGVVYDEIFSSGFNP